MCTEETCADFPRAIRSPAGTLRSTVSVPFVRGSRRGSKRDPRFLFASGKALSYNKAAFLTEYGELGKMRSGAARTAGGYGYTPAKGVLLMRITLHIGRFTVTIIVKSRNRHSAK